MKDTNMVKVTAIQVISSRGTVIPPNNLDDISLVQEVKVFSFYKLVTRHTKVYRDDQDNAYQEKNSESLRRYVPDYLFDMMTPEDRLTYLEDYLSKPYYHVEHYLNALITRDETNYTDSLIALIKSKIGVLKLVRANVRFRAKHRFLLPTYYLFTDSRVHFENGYFKDGVNMSMNPRDFSSYCGVYE
jgi:hypothetical protein